MFPHGEEVEIFGGTLPYPKWSLDSALGIAILKKLRKLATG